MSISYATHLKSWKLRKKNDIKGDAVKKEERDMKLQNVNNKARKRKIDVVS
jgi:hypothetical protein